MLLKEWEGNKNYSDKEGIVYKGGEHLGGRGATRLEEGGMGNPASGVWWHWININTIITETPLDINLSAGCLKLIMIT